MRRGKPKHRIVIDSCVLVAGVAGFRRQYRPGRNASADVLNRWVDSDGRCFVWLYSDEVLDEYKMVLAELRVRRHSIGRIANLIRKRAEKVAHPTGGAISPDLGDDHICQCAESGRAGVLITLNIRDFPPSRLKAKVVRPELALNIFGL